MKWTLERFAFWIWTYIQVVKAFVFFWRETLFLFFFCVGVGQCDTISVIKRRPVVLFFYFFIYIFLPQVPPLSNQAFLSLPHHTCSSPPLPSPPLLNHTSFPLYRDETQSLIPEGNGNPSPPLPFLSPSTKKTSSPLSFSNRLLPPPQPQKKNKENRRRPSDPTLPLQKSS